MKFPQGFLKIARYGTFPLVASYFSKIWSDVYENYTTDVSLDKEVWVKFQKSSWLGCGSPDFGPGPTGSGPYQPGWRSTLFEWSCLSHRIYTVIFFSNENIKLCVLKILTSVRTTIAATRMLCVRMKPAASSVNATPILPATASPAVGSRSSYFRFSSHHMEKTDAGPRASISEKSHWNSWLYILGIVTIYYGSRCHGDLPCNHSNHSNKGHCSWLPSFLNEISRTKFVNFGLERCGFKYIGICDNSSMLSELNTAYCEKFVN